MFDYSLYCYSYNDIRYTVNGSK